MLRPDYFEPFGEGSGNSPGYFCLTCICRFHLLDRDGASGCWGGGDQVCQFESIDVAVGVTTSIHIAADSEIEALAFLGVDDGGTGAGIADQEIRIPGIDRA